MYIKYIKRFIDIIVSAIFLVILSPIYVIIAILIKLIDKGSIIYTQNRTGLHGQNFKIYKFKTMKNGNTTKLRKYFKKNIIR